MAVNVSLKELIETGAHFGHQTRRWNPKMAEYIYGSREGVHIFDLVKTKERLEEALNVIKEAAKKGETILFVGTKKQAKEKIREIAKNTDTFYIAERWLGGILTNFEQVRRSTRKLTEMKEGREKGAYSDRTKKERVLIDREIDRLERFFSGLVGMDKTPGLMIVIDIKREFGAIREARASGVPLIAVVDSNSDPTDINYPIPMNDDASHAVEYVLGLMEEAVLEGKGIKSTKQKDEKVEAEIESKEATNVGKEKNAEKENVKAKSSKPVTKADKKAASVKPGAVAKVTKPLKTQSVKKVSAKPAKSKDTKK